MSVADLYRSKSPRMLLRKACLAVSPPCLLLKVRLSNGAVVLGRNRKGHGGRGLFLLQDRIEPELEVIEALLPPGGVFVDVGANTGAYSLKAARHVGETGAVIALEPFVETAATLMRSIRYNGFGNVRLRLLCAGNLTGASTLWMNFGKPNSFSMKQADRGADSLSALSVKLDDLLAWEGTRRLDVLKIDAEGSEKAVIEGASKTIEQYRPTIIMENIYSGGEGFPFAGYRPCQHPDSPNILYLPAGKFADDWLPSPAWSYL